MYFLLYILASIGLAHILVDSHLSGKFKEWMSKRKWFPRTRKFLIQGLSCYQCSGVWAGGLSGFLFDPVADICWLPIPDFCCFIIRIIAYGFAASFLSVLGAVTIQYLNIISEITEK